MIVVNPSTRQFNIPGADLVFGVTADSGSTIKEFSCPRYVGNNLDLTGCFIRMNYRNANGEIDSKLIENVTVDGDNVVFGWELSPHVTMYKGNVSFVMCVVGPDTKVKWHTTLGRGQVLEGLEPDSAMVEEGTADVVAALVAMVEAQTEAVENKGAEWVRNVQSEGTDQIIAVQTAAREAQSDAVAQIEAKGVSTLATIPEDYTSLENTVDGLVRGRAGAIVCEAAGSVVVVNDASGNYIQGMKIFGRSTQDGTPTPDAPVEIKSVVEPVVTVAGKNLFNPDIIATFTKSGATVTNNGDGSFTVSGSGETTAYMNVYHQFDHETTVRMIHSGLLNIAESSYTYPYFYAQISYNDGGSRWTISNAATNSVTSKEISESILADETAMLRFGFYAEAGVAIQTGTIKPMVYQCGDDTFEPYKPIQTLESTHTLPGIPVTSGGNYTDSDGQQWVCDEVDLERGVYVQRVYQRVFDGGEAFFQGTLSTDAPDGVYRYTRGDASIKGADNGSVCPAYCSHYQIVSPDTGYQGNHTAVSLQNAAVNVYCDIADLASFKSDLAQRYENGDPVILVCELANPIETALSETEIAAYRALHSNYPNTTILNDSGAHMVVKYAADTKLYIDNKIAALIGG